ncbi:uncharacterized protein L969DRAFT_96655 [Mixia osmundae IAM 14324]|uniref:Uncharacterized protein n=1 Tax=Mixia osmundae (strain CBS 9802 / IAM 14324 / JCM 22182 / KY 12970) TaxID=764103 RepID=G7DU17_MIXOS|nr:uncharacterized protein L969DRAFT_96655 [Mixia osmundae IAM 14324]KEI37081.1 hypothetical protein L969DRAFT_96655 [Mixia osmundae IAM 14324]GAA94077.1 hypothetical protein E5Q_00724 [Mixia osmundae IAM 14324]
MSSVSSEASDESLSDITDGDVTQDVTQSSRLAKETTNDTPGYKTFLSFAAAHDAVTNERHDHLFWPSDRWIYLSASLKALERRVKPQEARHIAPIIWRLLARLDDLLARPVLRTQAYKASLQSEDALALVKLRQKWSVRRTTSIWGIALSSGVKPIDLDGSPCDLAIQLAIEKQLLTSVPTQSIEFVNVNKLPDTLVRFTDIASWYAAAQPTAMPYNWSTVSVRTLSLQGCRLDDLPAQLLAELLPNVEHVRLYRCGWPDVPPSVLVFPKLRRISTDITQKQASSDSLPPLPGPSKLERIPSLVDILSGMLRETGASVADLPDHLQHCVSQSYRCRCCRSFVSSASSDFVAGDHVEELSHGRPSTVTSSSVAAIDQCLLLSNPCWRYCLACLPRHFANEPVQAGHAGLYTVRCGCPICDSERRQKHAQWSRRRR